MSIRFLHIYNRGVDKRRIYSSDRDRNYFLDSVRLARLKNSPKLSEFLNQVRTGAISTLEISNIESIFGPFIVDILAYVLMPNHFHLLLKEVSDQGIPKFAQRLGNSYTRYFNTKHDRKGRLFESTYQQVLVKTDEQLIHLSRYIHLNPVRSKTLHIPLENLEEYKWSSYPAYLGKPSDICNPKEILNFFGPKKDYLDFLRSELLEGKIDVELTSSLLIDAE